MKLTIITMSDETFETEFVDDETLYSLDSETVNNVKGSWELQLATTNYNLENRIKFMSLLKYEDIKNIILVNQYETLVDLEQFNLICTHSAFKDEMVFDPSGNKVHTCCVRFFLKEANK